MNQSFLIRVLLALALTIAPAVCRAEAQPLETAFSHDQYRWAVNWINGPLEALMANGVIESIARDDSSFQVQAGDAWSRLAFNQAGDILDKLSRARHITGHSPLVTVEQSSTGTVLGRATWNSIEVFVPGEGYIEYYPDAYTPESAAY